MMPKELLPDDIAAAIDTLTARHEPYAIATIVRTAGATAAKPGARAILSADGAILHGWLGGGCTRGAVKRAVIDALQNGQPQLISVAPEDELSAKGLRAGDQVDGVQFARNGCPSKGSIDVFIEPCLPRPELVVFGASPVAAALLDLAPRFDWQTLGLTPSESLPDTAPGRRRVIVIATQGQGDMDALTQALSIRSDHVAFVGSHRKYAALSEKLADRDIPATAIASVRAPAGLDIGAVTPEEIALSILAELTKVRRAALMGATPQSQFQSQSQTRAQTQTEVTA